ncbi:MAG: hypothetical protein DWP95_04475, partial [Proteobacteria bacterium]
MKLDFRVSHLKANHQPTEINKAIIELILQHQKAAGLNNLQLVKRMGFTNFNKALRRFSHFTQTGYLPENHARKLSRVLDIDLAQLKTLE